MSYPQLNKPSLELFLDLVNRTNDLNFKPGDLNIGAMAAASHPEHTYVNTSVVVTGTGTTTFKGPTTLYYRRLDLNLLFATKNVAFELPEGTTEVNATQILALLNARFSTAMDLSDIVNGSWSINAEESTDVVLTAKSGSLTYIGSITLSARAGNSAEPENPVDMYNAAILDARAFVVDDYGNQLLFPYAPYANTNYKGWYYNANQFVFASADGKIFGGMKSYGEDGYPNDEDADGIYIVDDLAATRNMVCLMGPAGQSLLDTYSVSLYLSKGIFGGSEQENFTLSYDANSAAGSRIKSDNQNYVSELVGDINGDGSGLYAILTLAAPDTNLPLSFEVEVTEKSSGQVVLRRTMQSQLTVSYPLVKYDHEYSGQYRSDASMYPSSMHGLEFENHFELFVQPWGFPLYNGEVSRFEVYDRDDGATDGRYDLTEPMTQPWAADRDWGWTVGVLIPAGYDAASKIADLSIAPEFTLFQRSDLTAVGNASPLRSYWPTSVDLENGTSEWSTFDTDTGVRGTISGEVNVAEDGSTYVSLLIPMMTMKNVMFYKEGPINGESEAGIVVGNWTMRGALTVDGVNSYPSWLPHWETSGANGTPGVVEEEGGGGEGPIVPMARGFFVSNAMARAVTNDFEVYQDIPDADAPVFGGSYNSEAAVADESGKVWAFLTSGDWTYLHRSLDGGRTWTKDSFIPESGFGGLDWKFMGRHLAYYQGSVYGYFRQRSTDLIWVCRLREEAETGGAFELEPIVAINQAYYPVIAADTMAKLVLSSEELDEDALSYELRSFLHWSNNLDEWTKYPLSHPWSTNPDIVPKPAVNVWTVAVSGDRLYGVGDLQWFNPATNSRPGTVAFFELDMSEGANAQPTYTFLDPWPTAEGGPGTWTIGQQVRVQVIDDTVLLYLSEVSGVVDDAYSSHAGVILTRAVSDVGGEFTRVEANTGIVDGMIYDNGVRTVISGRRSTYTLAGPHFMAYTTDRTLQTWQFDDSEESPFGKVDTTNASTYVSAVRDGEPEEVFIPTLTPPVDVRWPIPAAVNTLSEYAQIRNAAYQSNGKLVLGGSFTAADGQSKYKYLVRMNQSKDKDGQPVVLGDAIDPTFNGGGYNSQTTVYDVYQMFVGPDDDKILMSLNGSRVGGVNILNFAMHPAEGGVPTPWPAVEMRDQYNSTTISNAVLYQTPGKKILLCAEGLRKVNAVDSHYLARFNWDGTVDTTFVSPFNPGGPLAAYTYRNTVQLPDGRLMVSVRLSSAYRVLLLDANGGLVAEGDQPFQAVSNQQVHAITADPYSDDFFIMGNYLTLKDGTVLKSIERVSPAFVIDSSWVGHVGDYMDTPYIPCITKISDGSGYLIAKGAVYWVDEDGAHYGQRCVFTTDLYGKVVEGRVPLDFGQNGVRIVMADPENTGNAQSDVYYAFGSFDKLGVGDYPRYTNVKQGNWARFRVLDDPNAPILA